MATITITIDNDDLNDVIDALADRHGYDPELGLTKTQYVKQWLRDDIKVVVKEWRVNNELTANPPTSVFPVITVTGLLLAIALSGAILYHSLRTDESTVILSQEALQE